MLSDDEFRRLVDQSEQMRAVVRSFQLPAATLAALNSSVAAVAKSVQVPALALQLRAFDTVGADVSRMIAQITESPSIRAMQHLSKIAQAQRIALAAVTLPKVPELLGADALRAFADLNNSLALPFSVDAKTWELLRTRIEALDVDTSVLDELDASVGEDEDVDNAVDEAADALRRQDPALTREQARWCVVAYMCVLYVSLVGSALLANPALGAVLLALISQSGINAKDVARLTGQIFDSANPPPPDDREGTDQRGDGQ